MKKSIETGAEFIKGLLYTYDEPKFRKLLKTFLQTYIPTKESFHITESGDVGTLPERVERKLEKKGIKLGKLEIEFEEYGIYQVKTGYYLTFYSQGMCSYSQGSYLKKINM